MTDGLDVYVLFSHVLETRDLSRAGQLFSIEDGSIRFYLTDLLRKIEKIVNPVDYRHNINDQGVVEICLSRVLSCIRDTNTIDQHIVAMVSVLETCAAHEAACRSETGDAAHTKLIRDLLSCIFLHSNHRLVLQLALPTTCKFLTMRCNLELVRHVTSYISLACVQHAELVAQNASTIIDSILLHAPYKQATEVFLPSILVRLLPTLYPYNREAIKARISDLLSVMVMPSQISEDAVSKKYVIELIDAVANDQPSLLFEVGKSDVSYVARIIELYDEATVDYFSRFLAAATVDCRFADAFANDDIVNHLQLAALRWPSTRIKCVRLVYNVAIRSKECVAHCAAILIGLLLSSSCSNSRSVKRNTNTSECIAESSATPISLELASAILTDLLDVLTYYREPRYLSSPSQQRRFDMAASDPVLAPAINQLAELCGLQAQLVPYATHSEISRLLDRIRVALANYSTSTATATVSFNAINSRRSVATQTSESTAYQGVCILRRPLQRSLSESCAAEGGGVAECREEQLTTIGLSSVPVARETDVVNIHSSVPQPALNTVEQINAYVRAVRHEIPAPCSCRTEPRCSGKLQRRRAVAGLQSGPGGILNLGVSEPPSTMMTSSTTVDPNACESPDRVESYSLFLQFRCECASSDCLYKQTADYFTIRTKHPRTWLHFYFLCAQSVVDADDDKKPLRLDDAFLVEFRRVCEQTLFSKQRDSNSNTQSVAAAELFPALVHAFSTAFPTGRQMATMRREMANALYFDVFEFDRVRRSWTCFLCRQFLSYPAASLLPLVDVLPLLNDGFSDDLEVERPTAHDASTKGQVPTAIPADLPLSLKQLESRQRSSGDRNELLVLEGKVKEKRGYWSIFRRWKTRCFTLSRGHLLTIAASVADPASSTAKVLHIHSHSHSHGRSERDRAFVHGEERERVASQTSSSNASSVTKKIQSFRPLRNRVSRKPKAFEIFTNDQQKLLIKPDQRDAERWALFLKTGLVHRESINNGNELPLYTHPPGRAALSVHT